MTTGLMPIPTDVDTTYPPAPWHMHGQLWVSLFRVPIAQDPHGVGGVYGVALVAYEQPSPLTYGELLVARTVKEPVKGVTISDIWVDSPPSMRGGRELWAIPKDLCEFSRRDASSGRLARTQWQVTLEEQPVVSAWFSDVSGLAPRVPFKGRTWQPRADGPDAVAHLTGSARSLPCRGRWSFAPDGPLGWLAGRRTIASFRMADFQMSFG